MATRRNAPQRPGRPASRPKAAKPSRPGKASGGSRVSGSVNVSPRFTLFGGGLLNLHFGGGGRRGRRRGGGLISRLTKVARRAYGEMTGHGSGPSPAGGKPAGRSGSFDDFRALRPDLFDDDQLPDAGDVDQDDGGPVEGNGFGEGAGHDEATGHRVAGPTFGAKDVCDFCQGVHGHHWAGCPHRAGGGR